MMMGEETALPCEVLRVENLTVAYNLNIPSGPAMVLACTRIFLLALLFSRRTRPPRRVL